MIKLNHDISLDLYYNEEKTIDTKEYDKDSRYITVWLTYKGEKYTISGDNIKATIKWLKPDKKAVFNDCVINNDNTITINLTEQMLLVSGVAKATLTLYDIANDQVLSTTSFNAIIEANAVKNTDIESTDEFDTLNKMILDEDKRIEAVKELDKMVTEHETIRESNENDRITNEEIRQNNENERIEAESIRITNENKRIEAEKNRINAENARKDNELTRRSNEEQRKSNEVVRESNEEHRITAFADMKQMVTDMNTTISQNKSVWDDKYTKNEVDNKFSILETNIDWKESVNTYQDIASTYPNPQDGWTVNVKDTDYTYRYNGTNWVTISANAIPKATQAVDGLLTKEDKTNYDDANSKKHIHNNQSVLDSITSDEKALWNTVSNKVDKINGKGLSTNDYTTAEKTKLAGIADNANNYTLPAASSSVLGGVKTGSNITNSSGTISLTKENVVNALGYTPGTGNGTVTGVKGNAESSYRTGTVNITPANIGAAASSHTHNYAGSSSVGGSANSALALARSQSQNTSSSYAGYWYKLGQFNITQQYMDGIYHGFVYEVGNASINPPFAEIFARVKQQNALGKLPNWSLTILNGNLIKSEQIRLICTSHTESGSVIELWVQDYWGYSQFSHVEFSSYNFTKNTPLFPLQATPPDGTYITATVRGSYLPLSGGTLDKDATLSLKGTNGISTAIKLSSDDGSSVSIYPGEIRSSGSIYSGSKLVMDYTGVIKSGATTDTYLNGNKGSGVIINSTASAGYNMLARMKSTNGVFTIGTYNNAFKLFYTKDSTISAGTNAFTYDATILDESGYAVFPGTVKASVFNGITSGEVWATSLVGRTSDNKAFSDYGVCVDNGMYISQISGAESPEDGVFGISYKDDSLIIGDIADKQGGNNNRYTICTNDFKALNSISVGTHLFSSTIYNTSGLYVRKTSNNSYNPVYASAFSQQSSRRYKTNIEDMPEEIAKHILQYRVVTYDYKNEEEGNNCQGLIAEEVDEIDDYPVTYTTEEGVPDGLDYSKFVPQLIKMVQIQQQEIDSLKAEIETLKNN